MGKSQESTFPALKGIRRRTPFEWKGLDSDNGSEFIKHHLYTYCQRQWIIFTRSRSYKKNDSCHVGQKNWSVVRRLVGYDRYNSRATLEALNRIYDLLRLYVNFFQLMMRSWWVRPGVELRCTRFMIQHKHPISDYSRRAHLPKLSNRSWRQPTTVLTRSHLEANQ